MTTQQPTEHQTPLAEVTELFDYLTPIQRESVRQLVRAMAAPEGVSE